MAEQRECLWPNFGEAARPPESLQSGPRPLSEAMWMLLLPNPARFYTVLPNMDFYCIAKRKGGAFQRSCDF